MNNVQGWLNSIASVKDLCTPLSGAAQWICPVLLRPAERWRLCGTAGGGLSPGDAAAGVGTRGLLPPGPAPTAGPLLHPLQPRCLQEPACLPASRPCRGVLWPEGVSRGQG